MTTTCTVCELHAESTFKIEGMDCREEVAMLERRFKNLPGLEDFSADVMGQRLHVKYDAARLSASAIADAVADTGMRAWLEHEEPLVGDAVRRARTPARWSGSRAPRSPPAWLLEQSRPSPWSRACLFGVVDRRRRSPPIGAPRLERRAGARRSTSTC